MTNFHPLGLFLGLQLGLRKEWTELLGEPFCHRLSTGFSPLFFALASPPRIGVRFEMRLEQRAKIVDEVEARLVGLNGKR